MAVSVNLMVFSWCYNIHLKLLRQELMAKINGFHHFNGVFKAN